MPDPVSTLFTIGYEGLSQHNLLDLLASAGIRTVLDVRAVALSRKAGFSKSLLSASLHSRGIAYHHDLRLRTPKPGRDAARRGAVSVMQAVFDDHMATPAAQSGLADAAALVTRQPTCLLCFERAPHDCHRSIVAQLLRAQTGQSIHHL